MTQQIDLIVVDLDSTLLTSDHKMTERSEKALKAAIKKGVQVVIATGKTHISAGAIVERLGITTPGIYVQGMTIVNPDGTTLYQQTINPDVARQVISFAEDRGFTAAAYSGSRILVRQLTPGAEELASKYNEPMPETVGPLQNILDEMPINKVIVALPNESRRITALRWQLQMQLDGQAKLTQAMGDQLEILPPGGGKGPALKVLLKELKVPAERVLAIGDGENDIEMLTLAGIGVAVGNATQSLKDVADYVVASNDADGVAEAVERFVLGAAVSDSSAKDDLEGAADFQPKDVTRPADEPESGQAE
jgi:Cof subfamily protein (haloacid dehalogenase superfamily)